MRAKLKRLHSPDVDFSTYYPEDPDNFGFLLQAMIGPEDEVGDESFGIVVCSVKWFQEQHAKDMPLFGFHFMFIYDYNASRIIRYIEEYCEKCNGENWTDLTRKLTRIGDWEFEDYRF